MISSTTATRALLAVRVGTGVAALAAPKALLALVGVSDPAAPLVARLFATRELGYAAGLALGSPAAQEATLCAGIAIDLADAAAALLAARAQRTSRVVAAVVVAGGIGAAGCGATALSARRRARSQP